MTATTNSAPRTEAKGGNSTKPSRAARPWLHLSPKDGVYRKCEAAEVCPLDHSTKHLSPLAIARGGGGEFLDSVAGPRPISTVIEGAFYTGTYGEGRIRVYDAKTGKPIQGQALRKWKKKVFEGEDVPDTTPALGVVGLHEHAMAWSASSPS